MMSQKYNKAITTVENRNLSKPRECLVPPLPSPSSTLCHVYEDNHLRCKNKGFYPFSF